MNVHSVGAGRDFGSIGDALKAAAAGDTVVVYGGVYHEAVVMDVRGVALIAADGESVTIDGRYGPYLFGDENYTTSRGWKARPGELPAANADNARRGGWVTPGTINERGYHSLVRLEADGTTLSGVKLRNSSGRFLVIEGDGCRAEDCTLDFCYGGAINVATGSVGTILSGLTVTRSSVKKFDPGAPGAGPDAVATTLIDHGTDTTIEDCIICYNFGEGVSADKGSIRPIIRRNVIHTNYHWSLGFNYTNGALIQDNVVYWCDNLIDAMGKDSPADGFVAGSERASAENPKEAYSPNIAIVGNLFVGYLKRPFVLGGAGRPVQFVDSVIAGNTIIGRATPGKAGPVFTWTALAAALHKNTTVRHNVTLWETGSPGPSHQSGGSVEWRDNVYGDYPPAGMRGAGDVIAEASALINPFAPILGQFDVYSDELPATATTFDLGNYRPKAGGPAVGYGALDPSPVDPPDEPEPPTPDYAPILAALESNLAHLETAGMAVGAAVVETHRLIAWLNETAAPSK